MTNEKQTLQNLIEEVEGMEKNPHDDELTSRDVFIYNKALNDIRHLLQAFNPQHHDK